MSRKPFDWNPGSPSVTVVTPTIPGREHLLREAVSSVNGQTHLKNEHLIHTDRTGMGCATTVNNLAKKARGDYLLILADDDVLLPRCLELHLTLAGPTTVVYSPPLVWGEDAGQFHGDPPNIPSLGLIPTAIWRKVGGYDETLTQREDCGLWGKLMSQGLTFTRLLEPTWVYRFWTQPDGTPGNKSRRG